MRRRPDLTHLKPYGGVSKLFWLTLAPIPGFLYLKRRLTGFKGIADIPAVKIVAGIIQRSCAAIDRFADSIIISDAVGIEFIEIFDCIAVIQRCAFPGQRNGQVFVSHRFSIAYIALSNRLCTAHKAQHYPRQFPIVHQEPGRDIQPYLAAGQGKGITQGIDNGIRVLRPCHRIRACNMAAPRGQGLSQIS